eukprot:scaffold19230_cov129-Isochrysis_galbana.AAC.2
MVGKAAASPAAASPHVPAAASAAAAVFGMTDTELMCAPKINSTPSRFRAACSAAAARSSPCGRRRWERSTTVTLAPKHAKACAISRPTAPPPMIAIRGGRAVRLNKVALVR